MYRMTAPWLGGLREKNEHRKAEQVEEQAATQRHQYPEADAPAGGFVCCSFRHWHSHRTMRITGAG